MKELWIYIEQVLRHMISRVWFAWVIISGVIALGVWLLPKPIADIRGVEGDIITWWVCNGKWLGLGIFGFIAGFLAPFLAWKSEYNAKTKAENKITRYQPDVTIEQLGKEVYYRFRGDILSCWVQGMLTNKSLTGSGELAKLILRIFPTDKEAIDIPVRRGEPDIIGFRFKPQGVFPDNMICFELSHIRLDTAEIKDRQAEIRLKVVGQALKTYKVRMVEK